jgi:hypothetical protein
LHFMFALSNYTAMHVMVTARTFWAPMKAGVGNARQPWCRVASRNDPCLQRHTHRREPR